MPALFIAAAKIGDPIAVLEQLTRESADRISSAWHDAIAATCGAVRASAQPAPGKTLVARGPDEGRIVVGPSLSPDGTRVVFFSERDVFSIEMFLADARTGEIIRRLTDLATDPHLDSIEFLDSTGAWDAEGRRFVYSSIRRGKPVLVIVDPEGGRHAARDRAALAGPGAQPRRGRPMDACSPSSMAEWRGQAPTSRRCVAVTASSSRAPASARVNLFGYVVLELAGVRPFDRPDDRWRFVFNIVPGF